MIRRSAHGREDGSILILTLVLVVFLAVVVIALAQYVAVALKTSKVASERTETNADSSNVMHWAIEQFAKKQLRPNDHCGDAPVYMPITVSSGLVANGSSTILTCAQTNPINGEPVVHLISRSVDEQTRVVEATVEVPQYSHGARVADWRVDIPIAVPAYTTTTTTTSSTTTTTTLPPPNMAPYAADMSVSVGLDDSAFPFTLPATDPESDPMTISNLTPSGPEIVVNDLGGINVDLSALSSDGALAGGTYSFTYTVSDGALPSNTGTVTVFVDPMATPPSTSTTSSTSTTTTTLAPAPACSFVITGAGNGGNSGIGVLQVSNSGGEFTGWQVRLTQKDSTRPWQFTWGAGVIATVTPTFVNVSGSQTIIQGTPFSVSANLVQANGNPKIVVNDTLACLVISP